MVALQVPTRSQASKVPTLVPKVMATAPSGTALRAPGQPGQQDGKAYDQQIARLGRADPLLDAIAEGAPAAAVRDRLLALESRRIDLEEAMARQIAPAPRLHSNLAEVYRQRVAALAETLATDAAPAARELVCGLVDEIRLFPGDGCQLIEIRGELAAILGLAQGARDASTGRDATVLAEQVKMVAGTGFEPVTFRL